MQFVFLDYGTLGSDDLDLTPLKSVLPNLRVYDATLPEERVERVASAEVILCNKAILDRKTLERAPHVRFIGLTATGTDNVDLVYAKERGIAVCNLIAYCTQSVVEHVFAVLLGLAHNIGPFGQLVRRGEWARADNFCLLNHSIRELSSMTLGIVGYGELGRNVARIARLFNMNIMISRRFGAADDKNNDIGRHDFEDVMRSADVISLHCPLNANTRNMINADTLMLMKRSAILINTARGGLVDSAALAVALQSGSIAAAAIDVLPQEPPLDGDPLLDYQGDNLIVTPHIAWATRDARQNAINELAANYSAFLSGTARNRVV